jgi:hypothetical protein
MAEGYLSAVEYYYTLSIIAETGKLLIQVCQLLVGIQVLFANTKKYLVLAEQSQYVMLS